MSRETAVKVKVPALTLFLPGVSDAVTPTVSPSTTPSDAVAAYFGTLAVLS